MTGWYLFGCIMLVLGLLMLVPVGARAEYQAGVGCVYLKVGWIQIQVLPARQKKKKRPAKMKKKPGIIDPEAPAADAEKEDTLTEKLSKLLTLTERFVPLIKRAGAYFGRKLRVDVLLMHLTVPAQEDPVRGALLFANANGLLNVIWGPLNQVFDIHDASVWVHADFQSDELTIEAKLILSVRFGALCWMGLRFGSQALVQFIKYRREQSNREAG